MNMFKLDINTFICISLSVPPQPVRLVNTTSSSEHLEGRVEVLYNGTWGTVCHYSWQKKDADITCRQLGYILGFPRGNSHYGRGNVSVITNIHCHGIERNLLGCYHSGFTSLTYCPTAGVYCSNDTGTFYSTLQMG